MSIYKHSEGVIGGVVGSAASFFVQMYNDGVHTVLYSTITWSSSFETLYYASLGALVGLLVSYFGKKLLRRWNP